MQAAMARLVEFLNDDAVIDQHVIGWSCPVPYFGHLESAQLATVGINPSNREFVTADGVELEAENRRLPTLTSLGLRRWSEADGDAMDSILSACSTYFERNPYDGWFGALQRLVDGTGRSYYSPRSDACHLDIVPWATATKWGLLVPSIRRRLVDRAAGALAALIKQSPLMMLVLNGQEVVRQFETLIGERLSATCMPDWDLPRRNGRPVPGIAYSTRLNRIATTPLERTLLVVGWNHNVQSSFGVTNRVRDSMRDWLGVQQLVIEW
jgi:hypothetical protein